MHGCRTVVVRQSPGQSCPELAAFGVQPSSEVAPPACPTCQLTIRPLQTALDQHPPRFDDVVSRAFNRMCLLAHGRPTSAGPGPRPFAPTVGEEGLPIGCLQHAPSAQLELNTASER